MPKTTYELIQRTTLSGLSHHKHPWVAQQMLPGAELTLRAIARNPYDPFAIAVDYSDGETISQVGWIPRGRNDMLWHILRAGVEVRCKVISHGPDRPLEARLYVGNYITTKE